MALSIAEQIASLPEEERLQVLAGMDPENLLYDWSFNGRPEQIPPTDRSWDVALYLAGRGAGKTRAAAEWIREKAKEAPNLRFLLVARTAADVREVLVEGEALALDTLVPSPHAKGGFTTMGKLKRGDIVIGGDGKPCKVKSGFATLYGRPCYKVHVDGIPEPIIADANHKWLVRRKVGSNIHSRFRPQYEVRTTEEIFNDTPSQWYIERTVMQGSDQIDVPYDPYEYGRLIGTRPTQRDYTNWGAKTRTLMMDEYLWATPAIREQLLRGLQDARTANRFNHTQQGVPVTVLPKFQKQIAQIASSLGYRAVEGERTVVRERVKVPQAEYHLLNTRWSRNKPKYWHITSIETTPSVPVRCISVDSPDNTFLVTDRFIKTHNSGIIAVSPESEKPDYQPSNRRLKWPNGSQAFCTSADEPDSLRGVQAHYSWGDEVAAWRVPTRDGELSAWQNLSIATRLGKHPQIFATTTPKKQIPMLYELLRKAEEDGTVWVTRGSTFDNVGNLADSYIDNMIGLYDGTALAAQELYGELLEENDGALWTDKDILDAQEEDAPRYTPLRMVGVDPSVAENPGDLCGIVVVGASADRNKELRHAWVLEDASLKGSPTTWANEVVRMANKWAAPVVVEVNQGGALVRNSIHQIDPNIPVLEVHSKASKKLRAEPITLAYQQNRVHHVRSQTTNLEALEAEMLRWVPESTRKSPDRVDALVHALTALLIETPKGYHTGPISAKQFAHRTIPTTGLGARPPIQRINTTRGNLRLGGLDGKRFR